MYRFQADDRKGTGHNATFILIAASPVKGAAVAVGTVRFDARLWQPLSSRMIDGLGLLSFCGSVRKKRGPTIGIFRFAVRKGGRF